VAEAGDGFGVVRGDPGDDRRRHGIACVHQGLQPPRHRPPMVQDHQVRHHVLGSDDLTRLFTGVLAHDAIAPKGDPRDQAVPRVDRRGCRMARSPPRRLAPKAAENNRAHDTPTLANGRVARVRVAVGAELTEHR
jgi:hypothetical protein